MGAVVAQIIAENWQMNFLGMAKGEQPAFQGGTGKEVVKFLTEFLRTMLHYAVFRHFFIIIYLIVLL